MEAAMLDLSGRDAHQKQSKKTSKPKHKMHSILFTKEDEMYIDELSKRILEMLPSNRTTTRTKIIRTLLQYADKIEDSDLIKIYNKL